LTSVGLGKRLFGTPLGRALIGFSAAQYVRFVDRTTIWQVTNRNFLNDLLAQETGFILITWHGSLMMTPVGWPGPKPLHVLVSRHGDGEMVAHAMTRFGMVMVRGSTYREDRDRDKGGAAATRQLVALLKDGQAVALTPDGPRGPARSLSGGVITLARLSGAPILPVTILTARHRLLRSWDHFRVALPFSNGAIVFGEPIVVDRLLDEDGKEAKRLEVEVALNAVTDQAGHLVRSVT